MCAGISASCMVRAPSSSFSLCLFQVLTSIPDFLPAGTRGYFLAMVPRGQFPAQDCLVFLLQSVPSSYVPRSSIQLARPATRLASLTPTRTWAPRAATRVVRWGTLNLCVRLSAAGSPKSWTKCTTYRGWISATNPNVSSQQWFNMNWNQGGTFCRSSNTANTSLLQLRNMILRKHEQNPRRHCIPKQLWITVDDKILLNYTFTQEVSNQPNRDRSLV